MLQLGLAACSVLPVTNLTLSATNTLARKQQFSLETRIYPNGPIFLLNLTSMVHNYHYWLIKPSTAQPYVSIRPIAVTIKASQPSYLDDKLK